MAVQSTPPADAQAPHCSMLDEMSMHSKPLAAPSTAQAVCEAGQRLRRWSDARRERERPAAGEAPSTWQVWTPALSTQVSWTPASVVPQPKMSAEQSWPRVKR